MSIKHGDIHLKRMETSLILTPFLLATNVNTEWQFSLIVFYQVFEDTITVFK